MVLLLAIALQLQTQQYALAVPQQTNLMTYVLQQRPVLAELITKAGLTPTLSGHEAYTLLAPPEAALQRWKEKSTPELRKLLMSHLLKGNYQEKDLKDGATLRTLAGTKITICRKEGSTMVDGVRIVAADQAVQNGMLHGLAAPLSM